MPDEPTQPAESTRDAGGGPPPRPLSNNPQPSDPPPSNPLPPSFGGAQQYGQPPGPPQSGPPPAWPPPPGGAYREPQSPYGQPQYYPVQVNGGQILTMGIVAFFCAGFILGPMAYLQGTSALAAIDRGEADPYQRGNVSAGRICGLIAGILGVFQLLAVIAYLLVVVMLVVGGSHG